MTAGRETVYDLRRLDQELRAGGDPLPLFRAALRAGREALRQQYFARPRDAPRLVAAHARLADHILARVWERQQERTPAAGVALVAVGGYGRGELHPYSDIDLMLLLEKGDAAGARGFVE